MVSATVSKTHITHESLRRTHVWGCPVYVLEPRLQDGQKIPKWEPREKGGSSLDSQTDIQQL